MRNRIVQHKRKSKGELVPIWARATIKRKTYMSWLVNGKVVTEGDYIFAFSAVVSGIHQSGISMGLIYRCAWEEGIWV